MANDIVITMKAYRHCWPSRLKLLILDYTDFYLLPQWLLLTISRDGGKELGQQSFSSARLRNPKARISKISMHASIFRIFISARFTLFDE